MTVERLEVVANFVELCSYCGAACSGVFRIWYSDGSRRLAFETGRGSLSEPLGRLVGTAIERGEYGALPEFVREWNDARGWAEFDSEGAAVAAEDLLETLTALSGQRVADDVRTGEILAGLHGFVNKAMSEARELWAMDD